MNREFDNEGKQIVKIYCEECGSFVGILRDASIKKGTTYVCSDCNGYNPKHTHRSANDSDTVNMLKNMFGMK